jgi:hypothetical protein
MEAFTLPAKPNWTDLAWKTNLHYEMEAFTLPAELNRTKVFPGWCLFLLASRRPILLRNRSNFLGLKCVCTQKRLFLVNKRLLHQILSINENTCTWFDILAVQKCQLNCFRFGSAQLGMWIVTCSAQFSSVRFGLACSVNEA